MNTAFIAVLFMSATGALLVLCLALLRPLTIKRFNAVWHYHSYMLVVFFLLVPIGAAGGNLLASIPNGREMPNVPVIINGMITASQNTTGPAWQPQDTAPTLNAPTTVETVPAPVLTWNTVLSYVPVIWIGGVFLFMVWHGIQLVRFRRRIHRTCLPIEDTATIDLLKNTMNDMRLKGNLRLFSNDIIKTPMLVGLFKTRLILPDVEMSERELAVILKHELVHYKRRDLWVKSLALLANAVHWFNPAAYRLTKQLGVYCELSCDERVVADMSADERRFYGETILNVLSRSVGKYSGIYATLAESQKGVKRRLKHMMGVKKNSKRIVIVSLIAAAVLCLTGFAAASVMNMQRDVVPDDTQEVGEPIPPTTTPDVEIKPNDEEPITENVEDIRAETITLEGFDEQIQTKLYNGGNWALYYDYERYDIIVEGDKTTFKPIGDLGIQYAYAAIEHIANVSVEDELHRHMEEAAKTYTEVTRYDETDGFYAVHDDGKSGWSLDDYLLSVQLISDGTGGCYVLSTWHVMEASEGHGVRLGYMFNSFTPLTQEDALQLTLDANGKNDDSVQLLGQAPDGWYYDGVEITVNLGNGDTYSKIYNEQSRNSPALLHADLTGDGIEEMILILPNVTSNFAATNVHVLSAAKGEITEILTVLCTPLQEDIDKYAQTWLGIQDFLCTGASVAVVDGGPVLRIEQLGRYQLAYTDISWDGGRWAVGQQEITKYFLFSNNPQKTYDIQPQPLSILDESQVIRTLTTEKTEDFTQTIYRSKDAELTDIMFYSYIETGGVKYDLGQIGYGEDTAASLKNYAFGKFMDVDGVTLYTQHKSYGAAYDALAYYEIVNGVPHFLYEIANPVSYYQYERLLTVVGVSRSIPSNVTLYCMDVAYDMVFVEDLQELLGCRMVEYNEDMGLFYEYGEISASDPNAVYKLEGLELVKQ